MRTTDESEFEGQHFASVFAVRTILHAISTHVGCPKAELAQVALETIIETDREIVEEDLTPSFLCGLRSQLNLIREDLLKQTPNGGFRVHERAGRYDAQGAPAQALEREKR